jgi:hypothetical protein
MDLACILISWLVLNSRYLLPFFILCFQSILNAANTLAFMVKESQYKGGLDGSIPVLVQSVSNYTH